MTAKRNKSTFNQFARDIYRANRTRRTISAVTSGNPARVRRLVERRLLYRAFSKLANLLAR